MKAALFPRSLSLYEAWTSRYRWRITSLMLKSPGQGRGWEARRACNKIIRMTLPNRPEKDVLLSANKWGLAEAWPRSFRLMSWRNRQSLSGHNMQRGSSITAPPPPASPSPHLLEQGPAWWSRAAGCTGRPADYGSSLIGLLVSKALTRRFPERCRLLRR